MSDTQPLLTTNNTLPEHDNENRQSISPFFDWRRWFSKKQTEDNYRNIDDEGEHTENESHVGFFQLFRFADRIDLLLLFIGICSSILHAFCLAARLVLFGRVAGAFASDVSPDGCHLQQQKLSITDSRNNGCPWGIELNSFNYARLNKLCNISDSLISSTPLNPHMITFRAKIINKVEWLLIIGTVEFICSVVEYYVFTVSARRQTTRIRVRLFQSLIQRSTSYFDTNPTGQLNAKLFDHIDNISRGIGFELAAVIGTTFAAIGGVIIALSVNWKLTLILLCLIPLTVGGVRLLAKFVAKESMNELNSYSRAGQIAQEVFSSLRTVLSLNGGMFERKRYEQELSATRWSSVRKGAFLGLFAGWFTFVDYLLEAVGFIAGTILMHYGGRSVVTIGDILVVVLLYAQSVASLGFMGLFLQSFAEARGAAVQVFRLIDEAEETDEYGKQIWDGTHSYKESININGDIEFSNVYFAYPARQESPILRNLSLVARADETTALVGLSGCGKSTCVSLILRYYEPSSGSVTLNGRPIAEYDIKQLRQNIGVVSQEPILFGTSIYENIRYGNLNATSLQIEEAARQANAHNFIMQLPDKYNTLVGERGAQLSGGEKQRVALARALVKQPTLLLLDEATSALDNTNERVVQKALDEACKSRTTIVITHRLTTVKNAHHIYVLDKGNVVEEGTHETLMAKEGGKYQNMVKAQETERWNDNAYETMTKQEIEDEDEKEITERSRLLSNAEVINAERKSLSSVARRNTLLRLLSMNSPEWKTILAGCIAAICGGVTMPIMAYLLSKIVHALRECIYSERQRQVLIVSSLFLLIGLLTIVIRFFQYTAFALSGSKLTQRVRAKAFADFLRQEVAYFDRPENSSGSICARLSSDALALQQITGTRLGVIFETLTVIVFGFILGVFFSWQLTLIVFIGVMINFSVSYININLQAQLTKRSNLLLEQGSSLAVEVIHNMRTVKQLTIEKEVLRQYSEIVYTVFIMRRKTAIIVAIGIGVIWGLHSFVLAALYWRALVLVEQHELNSRNVIMIFAFATFFLQIMQICLSMCDDIGTSITGAQSFFDLFDRTPTIDNRSTEGQELFDFHGEIEFNQIKFAYPTRPRSSVLNNFQLTIKPNQRVALVGASGCGKSTIVQLLERFYDVTSGQLRLDGVDIRQLNIYSVRSCIGLVSQEPVLFDMTIAENIAYGKETFSLEDVMAAATKANVHEFIQQLPQGYATKVGMKGGFLSGGEKQRIAIARTIFRRPKLLLLDESTSAMDSHNERIVQQALEKTQEEDPSRASLIIAHRLSTIRSCDLICVVDSGRIVESGTHDELMKQHGAYYRMLIRNSS